MTITAISALKRMNKTELIAKINALEAEVDALYVSQRPSRTAMASIADTPVPAQGSLSFRERCARARELAMRTGAVVKL